MKRENPHDFGTLPCPEPRNWESDMSPRRCIWWTEERDVKVAELRSQGYGWKRLAKALGISEGAVRYRFCPNHRSSINAAAARRRAAKRAGEPKPKFMAHMGEFYEGERKH